MGRTVPTFREALEKEINKIAGREEKEIGKWKEFRKALRKKKRKNFDKLLEDCKKYISAGSQAKRPDPFRTMIMSILLEQEKEIQSLKKRIEGIQEVLEDV